ncbi:MAG: pyridoxal phosphate-dependent aminotransferase family protein [Pirellulales bacterium]|nr:pyridoxal phosphate-dependent aminotransferase family protein [Pirellulales bacterium]
MQSPPGAYTVIDGRRCLYFVGTGYLGLQGHPEVIRAACEAVQKYGVHSATTRAGLGNSPPVLEAERRAAEFFGTQCAFCFASGYAGNGIMLAALNDAFDVLFVDELSHYSALEAAASTELPGHRFRHRDAGDLAEKLKRRLPPGGRPLVLSDGVFAARGSIAPLDEYVQVLQDYPEGVVLVDDAHAVGVLGTGGRGTWEYFGLAKEGLNAFGGRHFLTATMSKALGGYGGVIPASEAFLDRVKSASHWYDGASAPPAPVAAAAAKALELIQADPGLRERLGTNVQRLKTGLRQLGFAVDDTPVPIICLTIGDAVNMRRIQRELFEREIAVAYLAAYAGLGSEGALRLAVFATHTPEMIDALLDALQRIA